MIDSSYVRIPEHRDDTVTLKPYIDFREAILSQPDKTSLRLRRYIDNSWSMVMARHHLAGKP